MVTVWWGEREPRPLICVSRIELRRCWVVLATQDQYTLIDFMGTHTLTHTEGDDTLLSNTAYQFNGEG